MTYASRADIEAINGAEEVVQRESMLPDGAVDHALVAADALIDGYLVGRYVLPLSPVPPNLPQLAATIARYNILGDAVTEGARSNYRDALAWLRDVSKGNVQLQSAAPMPGNEQSSMVMVATSPAVFKREGRP